jgi:hypothetical protein
MIGNKISIELYIMVGINLNSPEQVWFSYENKFIETVYSAGNNIFLNILYMCARSIDFATLYDFSIGSCSDSVVCFIFILLLHHFALHHL